MLSMPCGHLSMIPNSYFTQSATSSAAKNGRTYEETKKRTHPLISYDK